MHIVEIGYVLHPATGEIVGREHFDLDQADLAGERNPTGLPDPITFHQYLQWLNADKQRRVQAGWEEATKSRPDDTPVSRWERCVTHINSLPDNHPAKALGLVV